MGNTEIDHRYQPNWMKLTQLIGAGFVASLIMTLLGLAPILARFPGMDYAGLYGSFFYSHQVPPFFSAPWWVGMFWHMFNGIVILSILFDYCVDRQILPNLPRVKGLLWGGILWFLMETVVRPLSGEGFFARGMPAPALQVSINLICQLVYGYVLESMSRVRLVHQLRISQGHAA